MEMIQVEQLDELKQAIKEAEKDDTPYIGIKDDDLYAIGNPNKTEIKSADYVVLFAFPNTPEFKGRAESHGDEIGKETKDGRYFMAKRIYKNVYLTPRRISGVVSAMAQLEAFLYRVTENGEVKDLSTDEMRMILSGLYNEMSDAVYDVVSAVLNIPYDEVDFMLPMNTVENAVKIYLNNPSAVNEADLFFG